MSEEETEHISLVLFQFMCRYIVGTEETVKTKRLLTTIRDNLSETKGRTIITSGSYGERLEMEGSDLDLMFVMKNLKVYEKKSDIEFDISETFFEIKTDDTKLGFVKLLLLHSMDRDIINQCVESDGCLFLSNKLFKSYCGNFFPAVVTEVNHGPCLSDKYGILDNAFCLHSRLWISRAYQWMTRSQRSWPSTEVVSTIMEHGTLFVPIGVKGSPKEEIEWRISFSVGEKLLIYSFNHTQLLCYALLKIVLKDIICSDIRCKDLLCSYYLKNILFWVSEEISLSEWKPHNLIHCFLQCFKRLMYCVEYSVCPHYFIPEINMFENKIEGEHRRILLDQLHTLLNFSWRCILFSPQLQNLFSIGYKLTERPQSFADYYEQIMSSLVLPLSYFTKDDTYGRFVKMILSHRSTAIKLNYLFCLSALCQINAEQVQLSNKDRNKVMYRKYKSCKSFLPQGLYRDAVSGWLKLASLCYQMKQYKLALAILDYSLSKCSQEKTYWKSKLSPTQRSMLGSKIFHSKGLIRVLPLLHLEHVRFRINSTLIPRELAQEILSRYFSIPPVVFAHFLSFLCHYQLSDVREYRNSLVDLQRTISEDYFIADACDKSRSYNILGVALQMIGENDSAREAFQCAIRLDQRGIFSCAQQRLSMMDML